MKFGQIPVSSSGPSLLIGQDQGPVLLFNASADTTIWLGDDPFDAQAGDEGTTAPLPPLASATFDGKNPVYGSCLPGQSAKVSAFPGGLNFFQLVEILVKTILISASAGNGLFVYSGDPAAGNLIASIVSTPGTDDFGNPYNAIANFGNQQGAHFGIDPTGHLYLVNAAGAATIVMSPEAELIGIYPSGTGSAPSFTVAGKSGTDPFGNVYQADGTAYAVVGGQLVALSLTAAGLIWRVFIPGTNSWAQFAALQTDASSIIINTPGGISMQAPGQPAGTAEPWHNFAMTSGWSTTPGGVTPRYRLTNDGEVEIEGDATFTTAGAGLTSGAVFTTAVPAAYRPAVAKNVLAYVVGGTQNPVITANRVPLVQMSAAGILSVFFLTGTTGAGLTASFGWRGKYPLS
jgi:hypothetical protein